MRVAGYRCLVFGGVVFAGSVVLACCESFSGELRAYLMHIMFSKQFVFGFHSVNISTVTLVV